MKTIVQCLMSLDIGGAETHVVELSKKLKSQGYRVIVVSNGGTYEKELIKAGVSIKKIPMHSKKPHFVLKSLFLLNQLFREEKPDIVHAHARIPGLYVSLLQKRFHYRMMTTVHGNFKVNWILKKLTQWGNEIFVVSEDLKQYLIAHYPVNQAKIYHTINGIDVERFSETKVAYPYERIIHVGRLDQPICKMAEELINYGRKNLIEMIIVGGGSEESILREKAKGLNHIKFIGATNQVEKILAQGGIFVGVSRAALEAMSMNMPVVLGGHFGFMGILTEDKLEEAKRTNFTGRNQQPLTLIDLEKSLNEIQSIKPTQFAWERDFIKDHYSVDKMVADYVQVYENE